ncbi:angiopoietin-related protein 7 [Protopterus annectens]|uniref:angiopoietin-related protein 7 n=1 Tax=Protopterus annectens TaxID=7888 RepID=UPI001CFA1FE1|nr:angiopoietin-related protein 7 [Protopterus annectens]
MLRKVTTLLYWHFILVAVTSITSVKLQKPPKKTGSINIKKQNSCCDDFKELKVQVANLTSILAELSRKQEIDSEKLEVQLREIERNYRKAESRIIEAENRYSEMNSKIDIMQLQAAQTLTQTSTDAVYDCAALYHRNYRISGVYKLPADEFLGTPEIQVFCDMETNDGGWTVIQRRKVGLTSFHRDWKQYKQGFGTLSGDFWLGNEHIFRMTRQPSVLRIDIEDWEGNARYAEYKYFTISNELNSYKMLLDGYSGNAGRDSMRYHNNTAFSTKDRDNDKCVDDCAGLRKGGYWYNCCTDSNLNGIFYRYGEHNRHNDGITWYGWMGSTYSLRRVEMKIRPANFMP